MNLFLKPVAGDDWFRDAGNPSELFSITRFVSDEVFATRAGGYGVSFAVGGVDSECMSDEAEAAISAELLGGQRLIPENLVTYQIARKRRGHMPTFRHIDSKNRVVAETQRARFDHLAKTGCSSVELYLTLYVPPTKALRAWSPGGHAEASDSQLRQLAGLAQMLQINLQRFGLKRIAKREIEELYSYLFHLHGNHPLPVSYDRIAEEIPCERIQWNDDGIRVGSRNGKLFSLLRCPKFTHANQFGELLRLDADLVLVLETQRKTTEQTLKAVSKQETFANYFREKLSTVFSYLGNAQQFYTKPKSASSQAADASVGGLAGIIKDVDEGLAYTQTSLIGLLHSADKAELDEQMAHVHRIANKTQAVFLSEGIGALGAFVSLFPGAQMADRNTNVRRRWLREDHVANLSLVHAPYRGEAMSDTLEDECHAIFGTRDGTEFAYDAYAKGGLRGCIVASESRRGKSFLLNFLVDQEAKYGGFISIFDVGGSYESTVLKNGGTIIRCGPNGPRQNPFGLENTERNRQFAYSLVKKLLVNGGAIIGPEEDSEIHARVGYLFGMGRELRRLKHLILPATLQPYLNKWIEGGVYGDLFDNVEDQLSLSRLNNFEFEDLDESLDDLSGPLLYSLRFRLRSFTHSSDNVGVPKLEVYDELFRHLQEEEMADQIVATGNTAAKHLGGIILATQSAKALGAYANLIRTNCPDAWFLGGSFDRQQYIDLFELNERQLEIIPTLQRGESLLVRKDDFAKVLRLDVDERSKWHYTTHPKDRQRRAEAIQKYGREEAFDYLLAEVTAK